MSHRSSKRADPRGDEEAADLPVAELHFPPGREPKEPEIPAVIGGKYRTIAVIGIGGMGIVYEAVHLITGQSVAVKKLRADLAGDGKGRARFMREARAASSIGHPGIVQVLDAGWDEDDPYLALELLRGCAFDERIDDPELTLGEVQSVGVQVLDALAAAQRVHVVHRDIKPENVYIHETPEGRRVKVLDFGIAKQVGPTETRLTATGTVMGTPAYMSPEQARGDPVDGRADVWSVAAMLFEAVVGSPPFDGDNYNILIARLLMERPPDIRELRPDLPAPLLDAIAGGLQATPEERFATAAEMRDVLAAGLSVTGLRDGTVEPPWATDLAAPAVRVSRISGERPVEQPSGSSTPTIAGRAVSPDVVAFAATKPRGRLWVALAIGLAFALALGIVRWSLVSDEPALTGAEAPESPAVDETPASVVAPAPDEALADDATNDATTEEALAPTEESPASDERAEPAARASSDEPPRVRRNVRARPATSEPRVPEPRRRPRFDALRDYE